MQNSKIEPHKITKPIQLLAVWFVGLVLLVGAFIGGAATIADPPWLQATLGITAICIVPIFIGLIFLLQTKFRTQFLDDPYYAEWLKRTEDKFKDFQPENIQDELPKEEIVVKSEISIEGTISAESSPSVKTDESWEERERRRKERYEKNRGLFLVHTWRPSHIPGQVVDITIGLQQHREGPLTQGKIESVEYHLGSKFFSHPVVKIDAKENFRLDVSAYGPMLCLARVNFNDDTPPLDLERYINF